MQQLAWIEVLASLRQAGTPCALVTVTGTKGSAPRDAGARMIVAEGRLHWGTIGGGRLEQLAIERASEWLMEGEARAEAVEVPLAESAGQCCGGKVTLFVETFPWVRPQVAIFGAGHVGQALAGLAPWLDADVALIDGRDELEPVPPSDPPYELRLTGAPEDELSELRQGAAVVILTHDHGLDQALLERALRRTDWSYLGLIGSERKWARFQARLLQRGIEAAQLEAVTCPIGVGATSKEPRAIALAVAAQLSSILAQVETHSQATEA